MEDHHLHHLQLNSSFPSRTELKKPPPEQRLTFSNFNKKKRKFPKYHPPCSNLTTHLTPPSRFSRIGRRKKVKVAWSVRSSGVRVLFLARTMRWIERERKRERERERGREQLIRADIVCRCRAESVQLQWGSALATGQGVARVSPVGAGCAPRAKARRAAPLPTRSNPRSSSSSNSNNNSSRHPRRSSRSSNSNASPRGSWADRRRKTVVGGAVVVVARGITVPVYIYFLILSDRWTLIEILWQLYI